ncbi:RidA family protein [Microbacterium sp. EYE_5]|uniref:RidA family protein n=1 Tax=unclassified Microbacterium TaxID=2609290 RepID=UPI002003125F|nr:MULTISPECIES: RidA family protein [unclassified Microbacterium]MCK6080339.1 RidA family protein [Microbacterium sp. EYE_382]MCK6085610.1 RidA family protein [Microbacterium sp. EYE_384]MCK6122165.1 RidA family protein [Microbacterium sp. EYE_80]MCK6126373.1 RidA family protein [Microbacterium sp. EYE_79]MCK6141294.1 RidA family protein [Microbacterium sp. EYE_39]
MSVTARLRELGIELPPVVRPVASYVPAKAHGDLVYTAGQLPMIEGELPAVGKVGDGPGLVPAADASGLARQCALNALAAAADAVGGVDRVTGVLKVTGFVASVPEFTGQPGVINGASDVLGEIFGDDGRHARSAVGVPVLPLDSPVEVEVVFTVA